MKIKQLKLLVIMMMSGIITSAYSAQQPTNITDEYIKEIVTKIRKNQPWIWIEGSQDMNTDQEFKYFYKSPKERAFVKIFSELPNEPIQYGTNRYRLYVTFVKDYVQFPYTDVYEYGRDLQSILAERVYRSENSSIDDEDITQNREFIRLLNYITEVARQHDSIGIEAQAMLRSINVLFTRYRDLIARETKQ